MIHRLPRRLKLACGLVGLAVLGFALWFSDWVYPFDDVDEDLTHGLFPHTHQMQPTAEFGKLRTVVGIFALLFLYVVLRLFSWAYPDDAFDADLTDTGFTDDAR